MRWHPGHLLRAALLFAALTAGIAGVRATEAAPAPTVTAVSPANGPLAGGTVITITGTGFVAGATVDLGGVAATGVVVVSATSITATTAAHAPAAVVVTVKNADGQGGTISGAFTYLGPPPTLTAIVPATGPTAGATAVTLTGTEFGAGTTVTIGGVAATSVVAASGTSLTAVTPAGVAGAANVVVTKADGQSATLAGGYTYTQSAPPTVTAISPTSATHGGGTPVTITGTGFVAGATVRFGTTLATGVVVTSATSITAVTPAGTANALVSLSVTNADSQGGTLASAFRFVDTGTVTLTAVSPVGGPLEGGTVITLTGTNFNPGAIVKFGDAVAQVTSVAPTTITVLSPAKTAAGKVAVTVTNTDAKVGTLANAFTYQKAPTLTAVTTPTKVAAQGGTTLSLAGSGFLEGMTVTVGGVAATDVKLAGATSVSFTAPPGSLGLAAATVKNVDGQTASVPAAMEYVTAPVITNISPSSGDEAGGGEVYIFGEGFTTATAVTFGGKAAASVTLTSSGWLLVKTPAGAPGAVEVVVTASGLSVSKAEGYTYTSTKGKVIGPVASTGVSLAMFGGGTTPALITSTKGAGCSAAALTLFVLDAGKFLGYIAGAPATVNADWEKKFATGIPANTAVIIRCG
ncbi:MAG: hypothetical protein C4558_10105 [Dehalococcoidia bacterium]|nr:MAG: hypothetical protein C4558_10105 [Dehalococcoidia bacterium]